MIPQFPFSSLDNNEFENVILDNEETICNFNQCRDIYFNAIVDNNRYSPDMDPITFNNEYKTI